MNGKGKLDSVNDGIGALETRIAEQEAKRANAQANLDALKVQWRELCKRVDVDGEQNLAADIGANEAQQATAALALERAEMAMTELRERLQAAHAQRTHILYTHHAAALEKLNAQDTPLLRKYIAAARALLRVAEEVESHEAAKGVLVDEANAAAGACGLSSLYLRRLPIFDVNTEDVGPAEQSGSLEWFLRQKVFPRWPEKVE